MARLELVPESGTSRALAELPRVYGAALAASADDPAAGAVTASVYERVAGSRGNAIGEVPLAAQAIIVAMRTAPAPPFDMMQAGDREAVALARLGRCSVDEIAEWLEITPSEAKHRLSAGLATVAGAVQALVS